MDGAERAKASLARRGFDERSQMTQFERLMQLTRILSAAVVIGSACTGWCAAIATARPISMDECIQLALEHSLALRVQRLAPELARYALGGAYAAYDPAMNLAYEKRSSSSPGGIDAQGRLYPGSETESDGLTGGLGGSLPTGLRYSIGTSTTDTYGFTPGLAPDRSNPIYGKTSLTNLLDGYVFTYPTVTYPTVMTRDPFEKTTAWVGLQLTQPLLQNFWIDGARLSIKLANKDLKRSELGVEYTVMAKVADVVSAYYLLIAAQEQLKVQETSLQWAEQFLSETKKKVEVGVLAPLDEKQAEAQLEGTRADLLRARGDLKTAQNRLKALLTDNYADWQDTELQPTEKLSAPVRVFNRADSWQKGLTMRPDLKQLKIDLEKQNIRLRYDYNQLFPQLNLEGSYGMNASAREFSGALGGLQDCTSPAFSFRAVLTFPLSNRAARYNYKASKVNVQQGLLRLKELEQSILLQIDNAITDASTSFGRIEATKQARVYAEAALAAEQKKLENGKSTNFEVLRLQRDLTSSRSAELGALTTYNIALAQLALSEGSILEERGIKFEIK
jgi:outer membrane protein TolC